jgi:hypothetical protein
VETRKARGYVLTLILFPHVHPKLVEELVIMYNEISQALAVDGDILVPKPFLDLGFDGVIRWKLPASETFS